MRVILYQLSFSQKQERFKDEIDFKKRMKELWQEGIKFTPMVLVENIPGKEKPIWMMLHNYTKILKKEEQKGGN